MFQRLKPVELLSPLPQATCVERLRAAIHSPWSMSTKGFVGRARSDSLTLRCAIWYGNSFQTILRARLNEDSDGTHIRCRFGMRRIEFAFMCVWFGLILLAGGTMFFQAFVAALNGHSFGKLPDALEIGSPLIMAVFGIGLLKFCWYLARDERPEMIEFLKRTLEAQEISGPIQL
ncbi:MAG TPA: hypothetical protein VLV55_12190 [Rhizomicrobium sp.]|nr:hypothetical protein [Rhizomicrobium sp.]